MIKILPFKAIRPIRNKVNLLVSRPVFTYKKNILKAKLEENPFTFIRIIHPEFNKSVKTKANSVERFKLVKNAFQDFFDKNILIQDRKEHIYLYKQSVDNNEFIGVIALGNIDDYLSGKIKKHEETLTSREETFTKYLEIVGFNAEPVLIAHQSSNELQDIYKSVMKGRPEYEFTTTDRIIHELWLMNEDEQNIVQKIFSNFESVYIADGHHRLASSCEYSKKVNNKNSKANNFMAYFIDNNLMRIYEFNRLIKNIESFDENLFFKGLEKHFVIKKIDKEQKSNKEHEIVLFYKNDFYLLTVKFETIKCLNSVDVLDAEILTKYILDPLLGIKDLKTDNRIEFISGNLSINTLKEQVHNNRALMGFLLFPIRYEQIQAVADENLSMPPKSTWIEPKLRSGLTIFSLDDSKI